ncbi:biotin-dependent carboxyltransferase family protein [Streptomyces sp. NPDC006879]|uniref:5-oxoprolinase subunit C family protein n=1 Tax=Streptomyces sp. NPDC006879 TaxID=3364767 RepID=UPI0036C1B12B
MRALEVVRAGALSTVQDLGRPGYAHLGVPRSGALDSRAHRWGNRVLGNPESAATLETTVDGMALRAMSSLTVCVAGAPCAVRVDGHPAAWGTPVHVPAGSVVDVGRAVRGVRSYLAVRGGIDVSPVLGSRACDLLSGLGPELPLSPGRILPVGLARGPLPGADLTALPAPPDSLLLPLRRGPRTDWFTPRALTALGQGAYRVSCDSNRIGLRTEGGPALERARSEELPSEGMVLGSVQVPPDGQPVVFLADHPVTGGYPVIGVVPATALDGAAQALPGTPVRFLPY